MRLIASFTGDHRFLSNFWPAVVRLGGDVYPTVEHAYQASKTGDPEIRRAIRTAETPGKAKTLSRIFHLAPEPEIKRLYRMRGLLAQKFANDPLRFALIATGDAVLIEGNTWGDTFWGQCPLGVGKNHLGRLLVEVRDHIRPVVAGRNT